MFISMLSKPTQIIRLAYKSSEVPHATIELTRRCNMRCRSCYNINRDYEKTYEQIIQEINILLSHRKVQTITLLGGEPTLHPQIVTVLKYIKERRIYCQILTNGLRLIEDKDNRLLHLLKIAGIDRIIVHIDEGQKHVYKNINKTRDILFKKLNSYHIHFSLSVTIYPENRCQLGTLSKKYAHFTYFDGILSVLAKEPLEPDKYHVDLYGEYSALSQQLEVSPSLYIPSFGNDKRISWLIYYFLINHKTGKCISLPLSLQQFFRKAYFKVRKRQFFTNHVSLLTVKILAIFMGLCTVFLGINQKKQLWVIYKKSHILNYLRLHFIVIQHPPWFDQEQNQLEFCRSCPDATIRNGKLMPVCLADMISPLDKMTSIKSDLKERMRSVVTEFSLDL